MRQQNFLIDKLSLSGRIASSVKLKLSKLYGQDKSFLSASIPKTKRQTNLVDCVVCAICHLVQFCYDGWAGKSVLKFDHGKNETAFNKVLKIFYC